MDDLVLRTLFLVLFLISVLFKKLVFSSLKEIDLLKLKFQLRPQGFFFERKRKRLGLLSSNKRSPGDKVVIF